MEGREQTAWAFRQICEPPRGLSDAQGDVARGDSSAGALLSTRVRVGFRVYGFRHRGCGERRMMSRNLAVNKRVRLTYLVI